MSHSGLLEIQPSYASPASAAAACLVASPGKLQYFKLSSSPATNICIEIVYLSGWVRHLHQHPALSAAQNDLPEPACDGDQGLLWGGRHRGQGRGGDQQQQDKGVDQLFSADGLELLDVEILQYFANEISCSASK